MEITLKIDSTYLCIQWNTDEISEIVRNLFSLWQVSSVKPTYYWNITSLKLGYFLKTHKNIIQCYDKKDLAANLEYNITLFVQDVYSQNLQLHASCVDFEGNGVLFVGAHGTGKTTLALTAISYGFKALTDDVTIIGENYNQVYGFPRPFKICNEKWEMNPKVIPLDCPYFKVTPEITYLFFYLSPKKYYVEKTNLKLIIFPLRSDNPTTIRNLGETETLQNLLPHGFNCYQRDNGRVDELLGVIRKTSSFEILYDSNWELMKKVIELL